MKTICALIVSESFNNFQGFLSRRKPSQKVIYCLFKEINGNNN